MKRSLLFLGLLAFGAGCGAASTDARSSTAASRSPFVVAIEGRCPKLRVHDVGRDTVVVLGTYGLDEGAAWSGRQTAHAQQALALVERTDPNNVKSPRTAAIKPNLLDGLPRTTTGWAEGDLDLGGRFPSGVWLERTLRTPAAPNKGALFETTHDGFTWDKNAWRPSSAARDGLLRGAHATLPTASILCPGDEADAALSLLAAERTADGTTFVAGRCEDELHRPIGPLLLARYDVRTHVWQRIPAPPSVIFEGPEAIVNAGIVAMSADEAWVWAYRPFTETERERPYLVHLQGGKPTLETVPFARPIVSIARVADGSLFAIAGYAELRHMDPRGRWDAGPIDLPPLGFLDPVPSSVRLLEVQVTGTDVWVHGAVPIVKDDGSAGREHVLYTTAPWSTPLHCDRDRPPQAALTPGTVKARLGVNPKRTPLPEQASR